MFIAGVVACLNGFVICHHTVERGLSDGTGMEISGLNDLEIVRKLTLRIQNTWKL